VSMGNLSTSIQNTVENSKEGMQRLDNIETGLPHSGRCAASTIRSLPDKSDGASAITPRNQELLDDQSSTVVGTQNTNLDLEIELFNSWMYLRTTNRRPGSPLAWGSALHWGGLFLLALALPKFQTSPWSRH